MALQAKRKAEDEEKEEEERRAAEKRLDQAWEIQDFEENSGL